MGRFRVAPNQSPTKIEMISMKKFICVLLLYTYAATVYAVNPLLLDSIYGETPYVYDFGPEMDEEKLKQKVRTFNKNILSYIVLPYKPNISLIHSILYNKLFAYIYKFLYLYIIILADIYA